MKVRSFRYDWTKGNTPPEVFSLDLETIKFEKNGIYMDVIQVEKILADSFLESAIETQNKANSMKHKNPLLSYQI